MFYVRIDGISDEELAFLGYTVIVDDQQFKLYRDYRGDEYIVDQSNPYILVDDANDAMILSARAQHPVIIPAPPKT